MHIPLIGRIQVFKWPVLLFSLILVIFESVLSVIVAILPGFLINFFHFLTSKIYSIVPAPTTNDKSGPAQERASAVADEIRSAHGFVEICKLFGYKAEEHIVQTADGYLLGVHRIRGRRGLISKNKVVYFHHGLLMNSEIWICNLDSENCLPFILADLGYDVWLGNNRGNKYSKKHVTMAPNSKDFWDFSIDNFALFDIPDTINYILNVVGDQKKVVYIGFSQGSAQAFAALSIHPSLNRKVELFIALAPAMAPPGLSNNVVNSLMRASPSLIYLFFGRKAILNSTAFWQSIMYPRLFVQAIDYSLQTLFNWRSRNISYYQKLAAYSHLYSFTSVKSVVHWFQIIRSGRFHMFDDEVQSPFNFQEKYFYRVASFPTQNITSPILLLYGESDSLVDIDVMLSELPQGTKAIGVDGHEHVDMIWADDVKNVVIPHVLDALSTLELEANSMSPVRMGAGSLHSISPSVNSYHETSATITPTETRKHTNITVEDDVLIHRLSRSLSTTGFKIGTATPVVELSKNN